MKKPQIIPRISIAEDLMAIKRTCDSLGERAESLSKLLSTANEITPAMSRLLEGMNSSFMTLIKFMAPYL